MNNKHINRGFEIVCEEKRKNKGIEIHLPQRATRHSIRYDIYSPVDAIIKPGEKLLIWTDIKAYFNSNEALLINVRSSMGKQPVLIAHSQGWIESDYYENPDNDGNLGVNLLNLGKTDYVIKQGDRIAQCMFINYLVSDNGNTDNERIGGFGSTNK